MDVQTTKGTVTQFLSIFFQTKAKHLFSSGGHCLLKSILCRSASLDQGTCINAEKNPKQFLEDTLVKRKKNLCFSTSYQFETRLLLDGKGETVTKYLKGLPVDPQDDEKVQGLAVDPQDDENVSGSTYTPRLTEAIHPNQVGTKALQVNHHEQSQIIVVSVLV